MRKLIFINMMLFVPIFLLGTTRHICESDGAQGIQDSINASSAYDTVLVHTGTYWVCDIDNKGITMKDSIRLISPHSDSVILSGWNYLGTVVAFHVISCDFGDSSSHEALIKGFTITEGEARGSAPNNYGGGIYCKLASPVINSCVITGNSATYFGGGIYLYTSSPTITNNIINNNSSDKDGGGIYIREHSFPQVTWNTITNNSAECGGGIHIYDSSSPTIANNMISNNSSNDGGGIYIEHYASPIISSNVIDKNSSDNGGGIYICDHSSPAITSNMIISNSSTNGGGFYIFNFASPTLVRNTIINNIADVGSAIYHLSGSTTTIGRCFFVDNGSYDKSSGVAFIHSSGSTFQISNSHLYYNTFQPDTEIDNNTSITIPLESNFWWYTDDATIGSLIKGPNDHDPYKTTFISNTPGEPISIDSIRNYNNNYSLVIDSLENESDTLYLRIYGADRNVRFREAAVAIIKSNIYPDGIAVALAETDTNSGIYQGKVIVKVSTGNDTIRLDDIHNTVKVNSTCNIITIVANIDTTQEFVIWYRCGPGIEEKPRPNNQNAKLEVYPNFFMGVAEVRYFLPKDSQVNIEVYNLSGQKITDIVNQRKEAGLHTATWNIPKSSTSGVYFIHLVADAGKNNCYKQVKKVVLTR